VINELLMQKKHTKRREKIFTCAGHQCHAKKDSSGAEILRKYEKKKKKEGKGSKKTDQVGIVPRQKDAIIKERGRKEARTSELTGLVLHRISKPSSDRGKTRKLVKGGEGV